MNPERLLDGGSAPTEDGISNLIGKKEPLWASLREYLVCAYEHLPELSFDGPKYGWAIRYRKSGKTLVTMYPEKGSFTVLVVLGKNDLPKVESVREKLSRRVRDLLESAEPRRDGLWLWIRPSTKADIESINVLLGAKRRPKAGASRS